MAYFISHAQNLEDVMLWRALGAVEGGFYIDLGASDPQMDSVTLAFYERGWHGINVEPNPDLFRKIATERERDINLNICAGAVPSEAGFFIVDDDHRLSTMSEELAQRHSAAGHVTRQVATSTLTLQQICQAHVKGPIHFLKIDVEGAELQALQGADFTRWRPWIVLVEALDPTTLEPSHATWEPLLTGTGYHFVYFDGLNRFYVADEQGALLDRHFQAPPNGRDAFVRNAEAVQMQLRAIETEHARVAAVLHDDVYRLTAERDAVVQDRQSLMDQLSGLRESAAGHDAKVRSQQLAMDQLRKDIELLREDAKAANIREQDAEQQLERLSAERDGWMQELFESNRHAAYLAQQRQALLTRLKPLEQYSANLESHTEYLQGLLDTARIECDGIREEHDAIRTASSVAQAERAQLRETVEEVLRKSQALQAHIEAQEQLLETRLGLINHFERQSQAMRHSTSWRLTLPIRVIRRALGRGRG